MKYMLLIYGKTDFEWTGSADDVAVVRELLEFERELVSVRDGVPVVTDGPFAEAKEYLAGYFLIECRQLGPHPAVEIHRGPGRRFRLNQGLDEKMFGGVLLSHILSGAVPSALEGLASGFGMGPGVSPPP